MLIDDIKKANIVAMKAHDQDARTAYSMIMAKAIEFKTSGSGKELTDADVIRMIQKFAKELEEEAEGYKKAGRQESYEATIRQKNAIVVFLPKMMSEEEIRAVIAGLEDKSIPSVMKHFKANYDGQCDMSLVSKIARG